MAKTILVKVAADTERKMILWERDSRHPDGEVFIPGGSDREFEVFPTPNVQTRIKAGLLARVETAAPDDEEAAVEATDAAVKLAAEKGINLADVTGTGADGKVVKGDVEKASK